MLCILQIVVIFKCESSKATLVKSKNEIIELEVHHESTLKINKIKA